MLNITDYFTSLFYHGLLLEIIIYVYFSEYIPVNIFLSSFSLFNYYMRYIQIPVFMIDNWQMQFNLGGLFDPFSFHIIFRLYSQKTGCFMNILTMRIS